MSAAKIRIELKAEKREIIGRKVKQLRKSGYVPAVLYGKEMDTLSLQIPVVDFNRAFHSAGESTLVYLTVSDKMYPTLIHDVARDPIKDTILHADFHKVSLDEKIKAMVPVVFEGEAPAVKDLGGTFVRNINELEVEALPQDLPHEIKIDISGLKEFDNQILLKEIKLGDRIEVMGNKEEIIATVQAPLSEEELKAMLEGDQKTVADVEVLEKKPEGEESVDGEPAEQAGLPTSENDKPTEK